MKKLPVTLLSGFLGAGKTTLLKKILTSDHGLRIAVIVNDMSDVNIDAELIANGFFTKADAKIIEMHNGCICCTLREDLLVEITNIATNYDVDYIVIESTGVSEPLPVAETFTFSLPDGRKLNDLAYLDTLVTVIDGVNFLHQYKSASSLPDQDEGKDKTLSDLLIEQIEFSNVLLISKADLIDNDELSYLQAVLRSLNSKAKIFFMKDGDVSVKEILNTGIYSLEDAQKSPGWLSVLRGEEQSEANEYGIDSYVWHSRRPVHPERFANFLNADWSYGNLLRSKGFFWLASQLQSSCLWNQAGGVMRYQYAGQWWVYTSQKDWPENKNLLHWIEKKWNSDVGDCRQEIVFIGRNLNKNKLEKDLNECLLTNSEMEDGPEVWINYEDPFPLWAPPSPSLPAAHYFNRRLTEFSKSYEF